MRDSPTLRLCWVDEEAQRCLLGRQGHKGYRWSSPVAQRGPHGSRPVSAPSAHPQKGAPEDPRTSLVSQGAASLSFKRPLPTLRGFLPCDFRSLQGSLRAGPHGTTWGPSSAPGVGQCLETAAGLVGASRLFADRL